MKSGYDWVSIPSLLLPGIGQGGDYCDIFAAPPGAKVPVAALSGGIYAMFGEVSLPLFSAQGMKECEADKKLEAAIRRETKARSDGYHNINTNEN
jgi:hypothetical protein